VFSKTEREFLRGKYLPSDNHKRFLNYKIKQKEFYQLELPLIQNSSVSDFANIVSEFTNINCTEAQNYNFQKENMHDQMNTIQKNGLGGLRSLDL
jgi:hypothetical protein